MDAIGLRTARRAQRFMLAVIVAAVIWPYFVHFVGFKPAHNFDKAAYPRLVYQFRETPKTDGAHGIDFSQVWIASRRLAAGEEVYKPIPNKFFTKWRRRWSSTYHPAIHWLYTPVSWLSLQHGLVVHNLFSMGLFLLCAALALRRAGFLVALPGLAMVYAVAMLWTPTGLLHLERGQFDTYSAAALLCIVALFDSSESNRGVRVGWAIGAGLLSTLKVSAWPLIGLYWIWAMAMRGLRDPVGWIVPILILALNLVFLSSVQQWLPAFLYVAGDHGKSGSSFTNILPNWLALALPLFAVVSMAVACFGSLRSRGLLGDSGARQQLVARVFFPFATALTLLVTCATPRTHDYRMVVLFGLLPALSVWCARGESIQPWLRYAAAFGYGLVLIVAMRVGPFVSASTFSVVTLLLISSLSFLGAALYLALGGSRSSSKWSLLPKRLAILTRSG